MKDRDVLIFTLTTFARRMRLNAVLCEFSRMTCAILGALVLYQILAAAIATPAVVSALAILLALLLIAVIGFFVLRSLRPVALDQAAAKLDACMDLKDELKTGYWFARQRKASPLVDLQIRRAVLTVQRLIPSEVLPITIARSAFAAVGLAFAASALSWFAPHFGHSQPSFAESIAPGVATTSSEARKPVPTSKAIGAAGEEPVDDANRTQMPGAREREAAWTKLEAAVQALGLGDELKDLAGAIKGRDASRATQLLEESYRSRDFARAQSAERAASGSAPASPDLLARLQELFSPGGNVPQSALEGATGDELAHALDLAQKLDDAMRASGTNNPANHKLEDGTNPLQAAIPLERFGPREARRSQGQGGEFEGTTDVEGGAMGRRVTQSNIGAGGKPSTNESNSVNLFEADQVLGARTERLSVQLKQVKIEGSNPRGGDAQGVADAAYAATREQQAQFAYQNAPQHDRYVSESDMNAERIPLAYRGAVKEYFLDLNRNEK
jgi:hypothetical protein